MEGVAQSSHSGRQVSFSTNDSELLGIMSIASDIEQLGEALRSLLQQVRPTPQVLQR